MKFSHGIIIGLLVTIIIFYGLTYKKHEHEHEHEQVKPGSAITEEPQTNDIPSITIFYNPSDKEHKQLHKWLKRHNIQPKHQ